MKKYILSNSLLKGSISGGTLFIVAIMVGLLGFASVMTSGVLPAATMPKGAAVTIIPPNPSPEQNNLQLYTFGYTTPIPTPTPLPTQPPHPTSTPPPTPLPTPGHCPLEALKTPACGACFPEFEMVACNEKPCLSPGMDVSNRTLFDPGYATYNCGYIEPNNPALFQQKLAQPNCVGACVAKPVIYLYPLISTLIDVKITIPGKIIVSDPLYPRDGWKNVLADPDGSLTYQNKKYKELFFESDVDKVNAPNNGIVIAKADLRKKLTDATTKLGLVGQEQTEFLEYWLPELNKLDAPFILFSITDPAEKERIDRVEIYPNPNTFIAFLAYFKPLKNIPANLKPLELPNTPPARIGFTAVEWGGTIAK